MALKKYAHMLVRQIQQLVAWIGVFQLLSVAPHLHLYLKTNDHIFGSDQIIILQGYVDLHCEI
jgi:hypothetical protein